MGYMYDEIRTYLMVKESEGRATSTIYEYNLYLTALAQHSNKELNALTNADIAAWIVDERAKGLADASILARVRAVRIFLNWCITEGILDKSPLRMKNPKVKRQHPRIAQQQAVLKLLAHPVTTWQDYRNRALVHLLFDTGMRIGEACGLAVTHVDRCKRLAFIPAGKDGEARTAPFTAACAAALDAYLCARPPSDYDKWLFVGSRRHGVTGRLTVTGARGIMQRFCQAAGVEYINPHSIRHLFATKALNDGLRVEIVSRILGHSSVDLTLKVYAQLMVETMQREYDNLWKVSKFP